MKRQEGQGGNVALSGAVRGARLLYLATGGGRVAEDPLAELKTLGFKQ
jgi:hypothetical protein